MSSDESDKNEPDESNDDADTLEWCTGYSNGYDQGYSDAESYYTSAPCSEEEESASEKSGSDTDTDTDTDKYKYKYKYKYKCKSKDDKHVNKYNDDDSSDEDTDYEEIGDSRQPTLADLKISKVGWFDN